MSSSSEGDAQLLSGLLDSLEPHTGSSPEAAPTAAQLLDGLRSDSKPHPVGVVPFPNAAKGFRWTAKVGKTAGRGQPIK